MKRFNWLLMLGIISGLLSSTSAFAEWTGPNEWDGVEIGITCEQPLRREVQEDGQEVWVPADDKESFCLLSDPRCNINCHSGCEGDCVEGSSLFDVLVCGCPWDGVFNPFKEEMVTFQCKAREQKSCKWKIPKECYKCELTDEGIVDEKKALHLWYKTCRCPKGTAPGTVDVKPEKPLTEKETKELESMLEEVMGQLADQAEKKKNRPPLEENEKTEEDKHADEMTSILIGIGTTILGILFGNAAIGAGLPTGGGPTPGGGPTSNWEFYQKNEPESIKKYTKQNKDGTIDVKDPVTGEVQKWKPTLNAKTGQMEFANEEGRRLSESELKTEIYRKAEHQDEYRQNMAFQQKATDEQRKQNQELSQLGKDYLKDKHEKEEAFKKQEHLDEMASKYKVYHDDGSPVTEEEIKRAMKQQQFKDIQEAEEWNKKAADLDIAISNLELIDQASEITINTLGEAVPGGKVVKDFHNFLKATGVRTAEAYAEGRSLSSAALHGAFEGAIMVAQNHAGDLAKLGSLSNVATKEAAIVIGGEMVKSGVNTAIESWDSNDIRGSMDKVARSIVDAGTKKSVYYGVGKYLEGTTSKDLDNAHNMITDSHISGVKNLPKGTKFSEAYDALAKKTNALHECADILLKTKQYGLQESGSLAFNKGMDATVDSFKELVNWRPNP